MRSQIEGASVIFGEEKSRRSIDAGELSADHKQKIDLAFPQSLKGRTVLDVNSGLGAFCIEALRRGATRATGLELSRERFQRANEIAYSLGLSAEYIRADIEEKPVLGPWDVVLCLNVIHQLRDPIGTLRYLALNTGERLILGGPKLNRDRKIAYWRTGATSWRSALQKIWLQRKGLAESRFLGGTPIAYVNACSTSQSYRTYLFTVSALKRVLDGHMRLFQKVEEFTSEDKRHYLLRCTRLKIAHVVAVVGACSSGKSMLCKRIARNEFRDELGIVDLSDAIRTSPAKLCKGATEQKFPDARCPLALYHYDLSRVEGLDIHHHARDPATDILRCASQIDCVIVAPNRETLKRQLIKSEFPGGRPRESFHKRYLELYDRPGYLASLYTDWLAFCVSLSPNTRFLLYTEEGDARVMVPVSAEEARSRILAIYG